MSNEHLNNNNNNNDIGNMSSLSSSSNIDQQPTFIPLSEDRLWFPLGNSTRMKSSMKMSAFSTSINADTMALSNINTYCHEQIMVMYPEVHLIINELQFMFGPVKTFWPQFILLRNMTTEQRESLLNQFTTDMKEEATRMFTNASSPWSVEWHEVLDTTNPPPTQHDIVVPFFIPSESKVIFLVCPKYRD